MAIPSLQVLVRTFGHYAAGLGVRGFEVLGKLGLYILAAAALGAHDAGLFFLCITWVGLLSTIARAGFERAMTRHIAAEIAVGRGRAAGRAMRTGMSVHVATGVAAALFTWATAEFVAGSVFSQPDLARPLALSALLLLPQTMVISVGYVLTGLKRGVAAQLVQNALWPVLTLLALVAGARQLDALILALAAALTLSTLVGAVLIAQRRPALQDRPGAAEPAGDALPPLWRAALPLGLVEVVQIGLSALPVLALGIFVDATEVGAFSVAHRISLMIWVVIVSIGTVAAPHFAELHRRGEIDQLRTRLSGSSPGGRVAKRREWPGFSSGRARSAARWAARWPAVSPSKHSVGSGARRQSKASCSSVMAVPSGATAVSMPARCRAITSM